jgi:trehalose utilization protein
MVSFKSFIQDPQHQAFTKYHDADRQEVHAAQAKIAGQKSSAYKMMKKASQAE